MAELTTVLAPNPVALNKTDNVWFGTAEVSVAAAGGHMPASALQASKILGVIDARLVDAASGGAVKDDVAATATVVFTGAVTADETIVIGSVTYTAKAAPSAANEFDVGASAALQAQALEDAINALGDSEGSGTLVNPEVTCTVDTATVTITARVPGTDGNSLTLTNGLSNATETAFAGGVDGSAARRARQKATATAVAVAGDTVVITPPVGAAFTYTADAAPDGHGDFDIGANIGAQMTALADAINNAGASEQFAAGNEKGPNPWVYAEAVADEIWFWALAPGRAGNGITISNTGWAELTFEDSGALSGGLDAGENGGGLGAPRAFPNSQSASTTEDDAGDIFVDHGGSGTATVRVTYLFKKVNG